MDKCVVCGESPEFLYQLEGKEFCERHIPAKYQGFEDIPQRRITKEKRQMSQVETKLLSIITQLHEVLAELPKSRSESPGDATPPPQPPEPDSPATPQPEPTQPAFTGGLTIEALTEAKKLPGSEAVIGRIKELQSAPTNEKAIEALTSAIGEAQALRDHGVDPTALVLKLMEIQTIIGGGGGTLVGGTDVAGDMVG